MKNFFLLCLAVVTFSTVSAVIAAEPYVVLTELANAKHQLVGQVIITKRGLRLNFGKNADTTITWDLIDSARERLGELK